MNYGSSGSYREMEVLALSPARRVVYLYTHLLINLRQAQMHLELGEIELRTERLLKAQEIVHELAAALDQERGGELASRLLSLYGWILDGLQRSHAHPDPAFLGDLIGTVTELHRAFEQAATQLEADPLESQLQAVS